MCVGRRDLRLRLHQQQEVDRRAASPIADIIAAEPKLAGRSSTSSASATLKPAGPVRLATGVQDDIVGHEQARQLARGLVPQGRRRHVQGRRCCPTSATRLLTNHLAPLLTDQGGAISWLTDRLSGRKAASNCWSMPRPALTRPVP